MKSHVCIPRQTLLRFSKNGQFHYLDIEKRCVRKQTAKSFLTKENYYTPEAEQFLSQKLETDMVRIYAEVDNFKEGQQPTFLADTKLFELTGNAIAIQSIRNPEYYRKHILPRRPNLMQGRIGAKHAANYLLDEKTFPDYRNYCYDFSEYYATIMINRTSRDFFCHRCIFTVFNIEGMMYLF